ncbi:MAG: iron ABC transporter permease [Spirochaetaceae bacterium]|jgi:iron complex transport system permease protein|nr:iron ABC transporter permease [Spirochaetaceae bacterium]
MVKGGEPRAETRAAGVISGLIVLTLLMAILALALGRFHVPVKEAVGILLGGLFPIRPFWTDQMSNVILNIRLPRVLGSLLVGSALALSGASYQAMFRNPLVSPDLLGVSSGACVGAAAAILLHLSAWGIQICALAGGLAAVACTVTIPKLFRTSGALILVLAGVVVSGFMNAILGAFKYIADPESELASIVFWTMGSLASVKKKELLFIAPGIVVSLIGMLLFRWRLNLLALGDAEARSLGVNVLRLKGLIILFSTILTASAICLSGAIGWIGLIIPHLGRMLVGQDNKNLLPASALLGALFLTFVDTLARNLTGSEIPLSIMTGLFGAPIFIWLLVRLGARFT